MQNSGKAKLWVVEARLCEGETLVGKTLVKRKFSKPKLYSCFETVSFELQIAVKAFHALKCSSSS